MLLLRRSLPRDARESLRVSQCGGLSPGEVLHLATLDQRAGTIVSMEVVASPRVGLLAALQGMNRGNIDRGLVPFPDLHSAMGKKE